MDEDPAPPGRGAPAQGGAERVDPRFFARAVAVIALAAAVVLAVLLLGATIHFVLLAFAGLLFAVVLTSLAEALAARTGLPERAALALVVLALAAAAWGFVRVLAPEFVEQAGVLAETLPRSTERLRERLAAIEPLRRLLEKGTLLPDDGALHARAGRIFSSTFGVIADVVVVLVLGIYLAVQPRLYVEGLVKLFPIDARDRTREVLRTVGTTLRWWLLGRLAGMIVIGALTTIGLSLLGSPLALAIGVMTGLLSFIPYVGPLISAAPPVLIALAESPRQALWVVGLYLVVQSIESYVVTPFVDRKTVLLPPALTLAMQALLGVLVGGLGVLLAGPVTATLFVLVQMLYVEDVLGDPDIAVPRR